MIMDDQVLVDDDLYILDRIQEFLRHPDVAISPASKNLQNIIERKVCIIVSALYTLLTFFCRDREASTLR